LGVLKEIFTDGRDLFFYLHQNIIE